MRGGLVYHLIILFSLTFSSNLFSSRKFIRIQSSECASSWIDLSSQNASASICCDRYNSLNQPCYLGMRLLRPICGTLLGSWGLPLAAVVMNFAHALAYKHENLRRSSLNRSLIYLAIMLYRTAVLYVGLDTIEATIVWSPDKCFYKSFTRNGKCVRDFDFSDHIVLFLTHFVLISWIEINAVAVEGIHRSKRHRFCIYMWFLALLIIATYFLHYTALSFHYFGENMMAWLIFTIFVLWPWFKLEPSIRSAIHAARVKN